MECVGSIKCEIIGEVVPGWSLICVKDTTEYIKAGDYGLADSEGIRFVWSETPEEEPYKDLRDIEKSCLSQEEQDMLATYFDTASRVDSNFCCHPEIGYRLYVACMDAGYDPNFNGTAVLYWLFDRMGQLKRRHDEINAMEVIKTLCYFRY